MRDRGDAAQPQWRKTAGRHACKTVLKTVVGPDLFQRTCCKLIGVGVVREYRFHPVRRWRFDYAVPSAKVALEVEGGVWTGGRHTRGQGFLGDMEKYNTATLMGWKVLRTTPKELNTAATVKMLAAALNGNYCAF